MLKLNDEQYEEAFEKMRLAIGLAASMVPAKATEAVFMKVCTTAALEALADDFDVSPLDPGPDNDVEEGNVWPRESDRDLSLRAFGTHFGRRSWI